MLKGSQITEWPEDLLSLKLLLTTGNALAW